MKYCRQAFCFCRNVQTHKYPCFLLFLPKLYWKYLFYHAQYKFLFLVQKSLFLVISYSSFLFEPSLCGDWAFVADVLAQMIARSCGRRCFRCLWQYWQEFPTLRGISMVNLAVNPHFIDISPKKISCPPHFITFRFSLSTPILPYLTLPYLTLISFLLLSWRLIFSSLYGDVCDMVGQQRGG